MSSFLVALAISILALLVWGIELIIMSRR
jgi:hypothetical protein